MKKKFNILYRLENKIMLSFFKNNNLLFLKNNNFFFYIYMPKNYFYKKIKNNFLFLFLNKNEFFLIFKQFINLYKNLYKFYFFRLRLRGLGYRIKKITKNLYRFFFAYNHYFYFYVPSIVYMKKFKRNLIIFSNNLMKLNDIFSNLLLLKKLDFYERTNTFIISKKILYLKKRK